jgi:pyruvate/2-oxoacid:ferredoxin oxidoreductase alpha subunit
MMTSSEKRIYIRGNDAVAIGALKAGLNAYFAYPITPSSEIPETLAREFGNEEWPDFKSFVQASSELEAINMVIGAAAGGVRAMTATSSPGFSLKQEALSYAGAMELPMLIVNIQRAGPGLGNLGPEQGDYNQSTKGGGHGNYRLIVLAPSSVQEMASFPAWGFDLAFTYRNPVLILGDAFTGQLKEDIVFPDITRKEYDTSWATTGSKGTQRHVFSSLELDYSKLNVRVQLLDVKYRTIAQRETRFEEFLVDDADLVIVAYGIAARIAKQYVSTARKAGLKIGLFRPITLWPFPEDAIRRLADQGKRFLVVELSTGQMLQDVKLAVAEKTRPYFVGTTGGLLPTPRDLRKAVDDIMRKVAA